METKIKILTEQFIRVMNKWNAVNEKPLKIGENLSVTTSEIHCIHAVWKNAGVNVTGLAAFLGVTKGAVSQMVECLMKKELLLKEKKEGDKKTVILKLTKKGEQSALYHEQMHRSIDEQINAVFSLLSKDELGVIERTTKEIEQLLVRLEKREGEVLDENCD